MPRITRIGSLAATALTGVLLVLPASVLARPDSQAASAQPTGKALAQWAQTVWQSAQAGRSDTTIDLLTAQAIPVDPVLERPNELRAAAQRLSDNIARREQQRADSIAEARTDLKDAAEKDDLLVALRAAIVIDTLQHDDAPITDDPLVGDLVDEAIVKASEAEKAGDWLEAHGLYARLYLLFEKAGTYKADVRRLGRRRAMLRLYTPELLHDMVNARRAKMDEDPLPPFNALGADWREKLAGINQIMVAKAIAQSAIYHVDGQSLNDILDGGFNAVRTLVTTHDLAQTFPGIANDKARQRFVSYLDQRLADLDKPDSRNVYAAIVSTLRGLLQANGRTVEIDPTAILHEFADGVMGELDDFSAIIWPGDLAQFQRTTQGTFKGVGIQITLTEAGEIQVVTPLADTPAARAGIQPGDLIRKVDGHPTMGMGLLQAVDRITGRKGTPVTLSIEREGKDDLIDFKLVRAEIPIHSIKGWKRVGSGELDWDWFIDQHAGIGYVRLTQFTNNTTSELRQAVTEMMDKGLKGLVLDLRGNPGGLLSEAVGVASLFVDQGVIVTQEDNHGRQVGQETARFGQARLADLPVAVLVNGGSASASEIVAGALQDYRKAVIVGARSFGKGSVQHVLSLAQNAAFKLTTQYYRLPGRDGQPGRLIHRRDGSVVWGIEPDVKVEMLPDQFAKAFKLRQQADVVQFDHDGNLVAREDGPVDVEALVRDGLDPQLETAVLLIQSQVVFDMPGARARID